MRARIWGRQRHVILPLTMVQPWSRLACGFHCNAFSVCANSIATQVMGHVSFFQNDAYAGGAIMMGGTKGRIRISERVAFANNSASVAGAVLVYNTGETLQIDGHVLFLGNRCGCTAAGCFRRCQCCSLVSDCSVRKQRQKPGRCSGCGRRLRAAWRRMLIGRKFGWWRRRPFRQVLH